MTVPSDEEFQKALASSEVQSLLSRSEPSDRAGIEQDLQLRRPEIEFEVSRAREAATEARRSLNNVQAEIGAVGESRASNGRQTFATYATVFFIIAGVGAMFGGWSWAQTIFTPRLYSLSAWWAYLAWLVALITVIFGLYELNFAFRTAPRLRAKLADLNELDKLEAADTATQQALDERLAKVLATHVTEAINTRAAPVYADRMQVALAAQLDSAGQAATIGIGLAEVPQEHNIIPTDPAKRIIELVERLPGGSIGISGPRGVGKSTLLASVSRAYPHLGSKNVIAVLTAAPVEYQARDFLLYLFAALCRRVLQVEVPNPAFVERYFADEEIADWQSRSWRSRARPIARLLALTTIVMLGAALFIATFNAAVTEQRNAALRLLEMAGVEGAADVKPDSGPDNAKKPAQADATAKDAVQPNDQTSQATKPAADNSPQGQTVAALSKDGYYGSFSLGVTPGPFAMLGVAAGLFLLILIFAGSGFQFGKQFPWPLGPGKRNEAWDELDLAGNPQITIRSAQELRNIRFQRSYTSGWSGAIKIPAGIDLGSTGGITLQQQAESLPELVERFRSYVGEVVAAYGTVIFGIDELDKLKNASEGEAFLNGVKSVFGISDCFYLISVSEDALSAFDRRGIGIRDAFDSALDEILHVDFLDLSQARALLGRRILRLPDPFLQLCHMLSGGLPRDLIRHARLLLETAVQRSSRRITLKEASRLLVAHDLRAKLRATQVAIRALKELPQTNALLSLIALISPKSQLVTIEKRVAILKEYLSDIDRTSDDDRKLAKLGDELAAYVETMILVRGVAAAMDTEFGWEAANKDELSNSIARVRQALEISVPLASARIAEARSQVTSVQNRAAKNVHSRNAARVVSNVDGE